MGVINSTYYASSEERNSSDDDTEFSTTKENFRSDSSMCYLLPTPEEQVIEHISKPAITEETIADIEKQLEYYEKVSLMYLLYDDAIFAFEELQHLAQNPFKKVLMDWFEHCKQTDNWKTKLLEALSLVQNFSILSLLEYDTTAIQKSFKLNQTTSVISEFKRSLYNVCETLNNRQTNILLSYVKRDFHTKSMLFQEFDGKYLEFYLTHWMLTKYITPTDLSNLYFALQATQMQDFADNLKSFVPNSNILKNRVVEYYPNEHFIMRTSMEHNDKCYKIDPKHPGICLIINQEYFYTEPEADESLKERLAPGVENNILQVREGTQLDRNRLHDTFNKCGFKVIIKDDLMHQELLEAVQNTVDDIAEYSSLIICILSHGIEGTVYGVNSIGVEIGEICNSVCNTNSNLHGKPKILILQSCRGTEFHKLTSDGEFKQMDTHKGIVPQNSDMLVFCATVPGYASLRSSTEGSWFIQYLCDTILEDADQEHFGELCTSVQAKVCQKRWTINNGVNIGMIPILHSTLTKKFYLPKIKT